MSVGGDGRNTDRNVMKTGFNLLLWTTHVNSEHFPLFETLKSVGYDGVEIPIFEGAPEHFRETGQAIKDAGLACTSVTVLPDEAHSAISPEPAARKGALDHLSWAIECSEALGSEILCGPFHQPLAVFSGEGPTEDEISHGVEVHQQAADRAAQSNLVLALEPLNRFECYVLNTMADTKDYVRRVDRANFGALYDTFHANIEEQDPVGCIALTGDVIKHVHISENDRGTPGMGHIDFAATCKMLRTTGYDGWLTIEAFGKALPALAAATKVWRDFFPAREEVYTVGLETMRTSWQAAG
ncbi:MAG: sugar phosphate isomerase/epimerase family protein [Geminicoccaceae bacterium]